MYIITIIYYYIYINKRNFAAIMQSEHFSIHGDAVQEAHESALVNGVFSSEDAIRVLFPIINSKISFHRLEILSKRIQSGSDSSHSEERIKALEHMKKEIKTICETAGNQGLHLNIQSRIQITPVRPEDTVKASFNLSPSN